MTKDHKNARQYSDQMLCAHCGKQWDVNDPEPPECTDAPAQDRTRSRKRKGPDFFGRQRP